MSWIGGFLDPVESVSAQEGLNAIASGLMRPECGEDIVRAFGSSGAITGHISSAVGQHGLILVALEGRIHWSEPRYKALASESITTAIATAFLEHGPHFLQWLHGSFALAILCPERKQAMLAVDRLGIRPLAYHHAGHRLIFASRLDGIRNFPGLDLSIDPQSLFHYLHFHMVPSPHTIYRECRKLQPGEYIFIDNGYLSTHRYWHPQYQDTASVSDAGETLKQTLDEAVRRCIDTSETGRIGAFLSGGLDSSTVTGLLSQESPKDAHAYTIGFNADGYDEVPYARDSANHYHVNLHEYYVTPEDVVDAIPLVARSYDEPFGNASAVPAYFCARAAKQDGRDILLAGDGGDELFAGNARYLTQLLFERYSTLPKLLRTGIEGSLKLIPNRDHMPIIRKVASYINQANIPLPARLETYNFLKRQPLSDILHDDLLASIDQTLPDRLQEEVYKTPIDASVIKRMLYLDLKFTLADNDLRKVNRMCEIAGIEVRYPMLDEELVELSTKIPSARLMAGNELRAFYKQALADFLPPTTLRKKKHGFGLPFGVWMSQHTRMRELALDSLNAMRSRDIINPRYLDQVISQQQSGHAAYYGVMVWILVMLEQWLHHNRL